MAEIEGIAYRLANNWFSTIPVENKPINFLEIGTLCGANLISVAKSYGSHPESKFVCIDPWIDYEEYPEYRGMQSNNYELFCKNISNNQIVEKTQIIRDFSHKGIPTLPDDHFDMIYIDGNHQPEYVLEDAILAFRKLKIGGYLIFDDYGWGGPDLTQRGIDAFLSAYHMRIELLALDINSQTFCKKLN